ncbi:MAG: NAD-dependent epimerase/dehydratase family protein [Candidatus Hodarchaeales archaeon]
MKYLITGSTGFIGSHVLEKLIKSGVNPDDIAVYVRNVEKAREMSNRGMNLFEGDITDGKKVTDAIKSFKPDVVIHTAALTDDLASFDQLRIVNAGGTENIVKAITQCSSKPFLVYLSSSGVYGRTKIPESTRITEDTTLNPITPYQRSKAMAEVIVRKSIEDGLLDAVILRPPSVMGPRDYVQSFKIYEAITSGKFPLINQGRAIMTWVDVEDLVSAIMLTIEKKNISSGKIYNVSSFDVSVKELFDYYASIIGTITPPKEYPYKIAYLTAYIMEMLSKITGKKTTLTRYRIQKLGKNRLYDSSKIEQELSYKRKYDAQRSITRTVEWILSVN